MVQLAQLSPKAKGLLKQEHAVASETTLHMRGIEWQQLNHSVLIIGWGTDPQTQLKYWIIRNSFGDDWGNNGNFFAERGANYMWSEG